MLGVLIQVFGELVLWPLLGDDGHHHGEIQPASIYASWWAFAHWTIALLILAPVIEEFFFRGVLFSGIRRDYGLPIAALAVTVLFVALHIPTTGFSLPQLISLTLLALFALTLRLRYRSLVPAIAIHFGFNLVVAVHDLSHMVGPVA